MPYFSGLKKVLVRVLNILLAQLQKKYRTDSWKSISTIKFNIFNANQTFPLFILFWTLK